MTDDAQYAERYAGHSCCAQQVPVLLTVAEHDPEFLAAPNYSLAVAITRRDGQPPQVIWLKGHNHVSPVFSCDTEDELFGCKIVEFARGLMI